MFVVHNKLFLNPTAISSPAFDAFIGPERARFVAMDHEERRLRCQRDHAVRLSASSFNFLDLMYSPYFIFERNERQELFPEIAALLPEWASCEERTTTMAVRRYGDLLTAGAPLGELADRLRGDLAYMLFTPLSTARGIWQDLVRPWTRFVGSVLCDSATDQTAFRMLVTRHSLAVDDDTDEFAFPVFTEETLCDMLSFLALHRRTSDKAMLFDRFLRLEHIAPEAFHAAVRALRLNAERRSKGTEYIPKPDPAKGGRRDWYTRFRPARHFEIACSRLNVSFFSFLYLEAGRKMHAHELLFIRDTLGFNARMHGMPQLQRLGMIKEFRTLDYQHSAFRNEWVFEVLNPNEQLLNWDTEDALRTRYVH